MDKVYIDSDKENDKENNNENDDKFDPMPFENTSSKLLLVYQSPNVKRLLRHYGGNLILLDATYKTCKYSLFLFFLDIQTNVNTRIYNLSSGPQITRFSAVVAKKRKNFE